MAEAAAEPEVLGLIDAAPGLRPADLLTSAASPGLLSALDVGIASPDSTLAVSTGDGPEAMRARKAAVYAPFLEHMEAHGVVYTPMPWSCWGREHPDTSRVLTALARRAARRSGTADWRRALREFRADAGAALARRVGAMWRQCALAPEGTRGRP